MELSPDERSLLYAACKAVQRYDDEGHALVPLNAWRPLLEDLGLQEDSEGAHVIMGYLEAAGDGLLSYMPMLEALGAVPTGRRPSSAAEPPEGERGMAPPPLGPGSGAQFRSMADAGDYQDPSQLPGPGGYNQGYGCGAQGPAGAGDTNFLPEAGYNHPGQGNGDLRSGRDGSGEYGAPSQYAGGYSPRSGGYDAPSQGPSERRRSSYGDPGYGYGSPNGDYGSPGQRGNGPSGPGPSEGLGNYGYSDGAQQAGGYAGPGHASFDRSPGRGGMGASVSQASDYGEMSVGDDFEDEESFWARRGPVIQRLYHMWDCNQLSNETFMTQLQTLLGERVDIGCPESEFVRLTNKHRSARNLKFGSLMSALRNDAKSTARRNGFPYHSGLTSSYAQSTCSESVCGDTMSEAGSEAPSHAAGRPTSSHQRHVLGVGRRHYDAHASGRSGRGYMGTSVAPVPEEGAPSERFYRPPSSAGGEDFSHRPPPCYAHVNPDPRVGPPSAPPTPAPYANDHDAGLAPAPPPSRYQAGQDPSFWNRSIPRHTVDDQDAMSQCGQSDAGSVVSTVRSELTARNHVGHGNILTWGDDSRNITPPRSRQGRQVTVDPERGVPRAFASNDIF